MSDAERMRERATRLYALALKARDDGVNDYATHLEQLAAEAAAHADAVEPAKRVAGRADQQQSEAQVQQAQQTQPDEKEH